MIRIVAAMDEKKGIATKDGLPWQGKIPLDVSHFRKMTEGNPILMGYATYKEFAKPMPGRRNLVLSRTADSLRPGFELITDLDELLQNPPEDLWVIGGASVFEQTIDRVDELHLTRIQGDFHCTKFFPDFEDSFTLAEESQAETQNGVTFTFCTYVRNQ